MYKTLVRILLAIAMPIFMAEMVRAYGQTVIYKGSSPDGAFAVIDTGQSSGVFAGTQICFKGGFCSPVEKARTRVSAVRLSDDQYAQVELNEQVTIGILQNSATSAESKTLKLIEFGYRYAHQLPIIFDAPGFSAGARAAQSGPIWSHSYTVERSAAGIFVGTLFDVGDNRFVPLRLSWHRLLPETSSYDFAPTDPENYGQTKTSGNLARLESGWTALLWESLGFAVFGGGELDLAKIDATIRADSSGSESEAKHSLTNLKVSAFALSLHGSILCHYVLADHWLFSSGLSLGYPLALLSKKVTGTYSLPDDMDIMSSDIDDIRGVINLRKSTYTLDVTAGFAYEL